MTPVSPVHPSLKLPEKIYGGPDANQPQYIGLPCYRLQDDCDTVISRWQLTFRERIQVLFFGYVFLSVLKFGHKLQPVKLSTEWPEADLNRTHV